MKANSTTFISEMETAKANPFADSDLLRTMIETLNYVNTNT